MEEEWEPPPSKKRPRSPPLPDGEERPTISIRDIRNDPIVKPADDEDGYQTSESEGPPPEGVNRISWQSFLRFVPPPEKKKKRKFRWDKGYRRLKGLKKEYGTVEILGKYEGDLEFQAWLEEVRERFNQKSRGNAASLSDRRFEALQSLGFRATIETVNENKETTNFERRLQQLKAFKKEFNHVKVPRGYTAIEGLREWVVETRRHMKAKERGEPSELTEDQINALTELGLTGSKKRGNLGAERAKGMQQYSTEASPALSTSDFTQRIAELKTFQAHFGSTCIPRDSDMAPGLREWTKKLRKQFWEKAGGCPTELTDGQIYELNEIGFQWEDEEEEEALKGDAAEQTGHEKPLEIKLESTESTNHKNGNKETFADRVSQLKHWQKNHSSADSESNEHTADLKQAARTLHYGQPGIRIKEEPETNVYANGPADFDETNSLANRDINCLQKLPKRKPAKSASKLHINSWMTRMNQLREFKATHGHIKVPEKYPPDQHFADWVHQQQQLFVRRWSGDETALTDDRFQALQQVGFIGQAVKAAPLTFDERVSQLKDFYELHRHTKVPKKYEIAKGLRKWLLRMRAQFTALEQGRESRLSFGEIEVLNNLDFDWRGTRTNATSEQLPGDGGNGLFYSQANREKLRKAPTDNNMINGQKEVERRNGGTTASSSNVGNGRDKNNVTGHVASDAQAKSPGLKETTKIKAEEDSTTQAPAVKTEYDTSWEGRFKQLEDYKAKHGDTEVPLIYDEDQGFATWVRTQRRLFSKRVGGLTDALSDERYNLLKNVGFGSSSKKPVAKGPPTFESRLTQLKEYKAMNGNTNVPLLYEPDQAFATWVRMQRRLYSSRLRGITDALSDDRFYALKKLDFAA